jgi:NAD(P)H dehydrogenase (quinone)
MQTFLDQTGPLWMKGALVGKVGSVFTSTASQHGGQETTLLGLYTFLAHQGMVIVGVPYACPNLLTLDQITGGSPYGAAAIAGPRGERPVSENERAIARFQGRHVSQIAKKLAAK